MVEYLKSHLIDVVCQWGKSEDPDELVDITNLCAMIWWHMSRNNADGGLQ